jgi:hypothetical protein
MVLENKTNGGHVLWMNIPIFSKLMFPFTTMNKLYMFYVELKDVPH